jgi:hypothetical protein
VFLEQEYPLDGRVRIRCLVCGKESPAIYRFFVGDRHMAKSYHDDTMRLFFERHADCWLSDENGYHVPLPQLEFILD